MFPPIRKGCLHLLLPMFHQLNAFSSPAQLVPLPRTPSVASILKGYLKQATEADAATRLIVDGSPCFSLLCATLICGSSFAFCATLGVKHLFDEDLGSHLLYRLERTQYKNVLKKNPDAKPSNIYGAEHLMRLFGPSIS
jgi:mortality factor 4-like protein 1